MGFERALNYGRAGETAISRWLRSRGNMVLPVYEKIMDDKKGPRLFLPEGELIAPDFLVFNGERAQWIEAKHKTAFTWHRITGRWVTGIDLRHYEDYLRIDDETPWPVWLMLLHDGGRAKDSPDGSPSGLFGNSLSVLRNCENHRHANWGRSGMVYWSINAFTRLADYGAVMGCEAVAA